MITWSRVVATAPELAAVSSDSQAEILLEVGLMVSQSVWGDWYDLGCKYLAAHLGAVALRKGQGSLNSETVGSVSASYNAPDATDDMCSTAYGQRYVQMAQTVGSGGSVL